MAIGDLPGINYFLAGFNYFVFLTAMFKKLITIISISVAALNAYAQPQDLSHIADSITTEAKTLYRSEMASWYGTDVLVANYPVKRQLSAGYFSYLSGTGGTCVFFSKGEEPKVLISFTFDNTYNIHTVVTDTTERKFSKPEAELYAIRKQALLRINNDTTFKHYRVGTLNVIPMVINKQKRVYVLNGSSQNNLIVIGNDYLIDFNKHNEITEVKRLHKGLLTFESKPGQKALIHSHLPEYSPYITATDICTLMLYKSFTTSKQHYVISSANVSIWDYDKNSLLILTREAWDKINADQKERQLDKN
jgi:hypothetical protein